MAVNKTQYPGKPMSYEQLVQWQAPKVESIISDGILNPQCRFILYGIFKSYKTWSVLNLAFMLDQGKDWLGFKTRKTRVLLIQLEGSLMMLQDRVMEFAQGNKITPDTLLFHWEHQLKLDKPYGHAMLSGLIEKYQPDFVILDPVYKLLSGDISSSYDVQKMIDNLDEIIMKYDVSVGLVHHTRKPVIMPDGIVSRGAEEMMGSSYLGNWCDTAIGISRIGETAVPTVMMNFTTLRHAKKDIKPVYVEIGSDLVFRPVVETVEASLDLDKIFQKGVYE